MKSITNFFNILPPKMEEDSTHPYEANPSQALALLEVQNFSVMYRMGKVTAIIE